MKKLIIISLLFWLLVSSSFAIETIELSTQITKPAITNYRVSWLGLYWDLGKIVIELKSPSTNETVIFEYSGTEALNLMKIMNKKNFAITSMQKTILQKLITDGKLAGIISGSSD